MFYAKCLAVAALVALSTTSVSAATYTFDLQNTNSDNWENGPGDHGEVSGNTLTIVQGGDIVDLTGTFTGRFLIGASYDDGELTFSGIDEATSVRRWYNGLGACSGGECFDSLGDPVHTVDGLGENRDRSEFIEMSFFSGATAVDVALQSLRFGYVADYGGVYSDANGAFEIIVDSFKNDGINLSDMLAFSGDASDIWLVRGSGLYDLGQVEGLMGKEYHTYGVKAGPGGSWKLLSASVDFEPTTVVPLPAAAWLLLGGLGGLAALRRSKKRA